MALEDAFQSQILPVILLSCPLSGPLSCNRGRKLDFDSIMKKFSFSKIKLKFHENICFSSFSYTNITLHGIIEIYIIHIYFDFSCLIVLLRRALTIPYTTSARELFAVPLPRPVRHARDIRRPSTKNVRISPFPEMYLVYLSIGSVWYTLTCSKPRNKLDTERWLACTGRLEGRYGASFHKKFNAATFI